MSDLPEMGKWDMAAEALFPYLLFVFGSFVRDPVAGAQP
jgi:hypothetical protein